MDIQVSIPDLPKFISDIGVAKEQADTLATAAIRNSVNKIQTLARQNAPHRTGTLQRSILAEVQYPDGLVTVNELYGTYIELGTRPHVILPKKAKALYWAGAAHPVRKVNHPGTPPRPFLQPAVDSARPYIQEQFTKVLGIISKVMEGDGGTTNDLG